MSLRRNFLLLPLLPLGRSATADPGDGEAALASLRALLQAYGEGRTDAAQALLAPQMTGHARLASAMRETAGSSRQVLITLTDTKAVASKDLVVIESQWDKRYLALPALAHGRSSGRSTFIMRRQDGAWLLFATDGDALFAPH